MVSLTGPRNWPTGANSSTLGVIPFTAPRTTDGLSSLKDPETNQIVEGLAGQAIGLLLSSRDYLKAAPIGRDDPEKARLLSRLLMAVIESPGVFRTNYQGFKDAYIFGTAIWELGWDRRDRVQMTRDGPKRVTYKNEPLLRLVDIYDFYPDPSGTRIQEDMLGVAKRFRISKFEAKDLAKKGVYDPVMVDEAIRLSQGNNMAKVTSEEKKFAEYANAMNPPDKYGMLVGFEFWGQVPWNPFDGARNRVITILNGVHVRGHINTYP